jgi:hypothetical protein
MSETKPMMRGVVHGKTIELEEEPGLPDGQPVTVTVQPVSQQEQLASGEGIRESAGAWADAGDEVDAWLEEMRRSRQLERPETP